MSARDQINKLIIDHLENNPPTLGHGFSHLCIVANRCEELANENNFNKDIAWVTGMLHDIYRPAEGGGQEDHETIGARIAKQLLLKTDLKNHAEEIAEAILDHDKKILDGNGNLLMEILSLADKSIMSFQRAIAYSWSSKVYKNYIEVIRDFSAYQVKAWKIFLKIGLDNKKGIEAYLDMNRKLNDKVSREKNGLIEFENDIRDISRKEAELEIEYLKKAGANELTIKKICTNFLELV